MAFLDRLDQLDHIAEAPLHTWPRRVAWSRSLAVLIAHRRAPRGRAYRARGSRGLIRCTSVVLRYIDKPSLFALAHSRARSRLVGGARHAHVLSAVARRRGHRADRRVDVAVGALGGGHRRGDHSGPSARYRRQSPRAPHPYAGEGAGALGDAGDRDRRRRRRADDVPERAADRREPAGVGGRGGSGRRYCRAAGARQSDRRLADRAVAARSASTTSSSFRASGGASRKSPGRMCRCACGTSGG